MAEHATKQILKVVYALTGRAVFYLLKHTNSYLRARQCHKITLPNFTSRYIRCLKVMLNILIINPKNIS